MYSNSNSLLIDINIGMLYCYTQLRLHIHLRPDAGYLKSIMEVVGIVMGNNPLWSFGLFWVFQRRAFW